MVICMILKGFGKICASQKIHQNHVLDLLFGWFFILYILYQGESPLNHHLYKSFKMFLFFQPPLNKSPFFTTI